MDKTHLGAERRHHRWLTAALTAGRASARRTPEAPRTSGTFSRLRAIIVTLALIVMPMTSVMSAAVADAVTKTSPDGRLTFTYSAPATVVSGSSVTYTYTVQNNTNDTFYLSSVTDSNCKPTPNRKVLRAKESDSFTCTRDNVTATSTSTANISYYTYDEFWDPLRWFPKYTCISNTTTVVVTPNTAVNPPFSCETPSVLIGANNAFSSTMPTMLYNQHQFPTGSQFIEIGDNTTPKKVQYNAMAWNPADGYIYAISSRPVGSQADSSWLPIGLLLRIDATGQANAVNGTPIANFYGSGSNQCDDGYCNTDAEGGLTSGAIANGVYYVSNASASGTKYMYKINLSDVLNNGTAPTATRISTNATFVTNDFAYLDGFLWGIQNGSAGPIMLRYNVATGAVNSYDLGKLIPEGKTYGAAWNYGNGNLGFSANDGSGVNQIKVTNPTTTPTFSLVYRITGPGSSNNDGTSCVVNNSVDLAITKTGPTAPFVGSKVTWNLLIANKGSGVSSGGLLTDVVPAGFTDVAVAPEYSGVCTVSGNTVTCQTGVLNPGDSYVIPVTATAPGTPGCLTNTATVTGNEKDPVPGNNTSQFATCMTNAILDVAKQAGTVTKNTDGSYTAGYTVSVQNSGTGAGTYTQITDVPRFSEGTAVQSVTWSGGPTAAGTTAAAATADGGYLIGTADSKGIAAGATHTYTVKVTFTASNPSLVTQCTGTPGNGLYNQVSLPQEDPSKTGANNAACDAPSGWINVAKSVPTTDAVTGPDNDGRYTVTYLVKVTDNGLGAGNYGPIHDTLAFDSKLTPISASWSGPATGSKNFAAAPYTFDFGAASTPIALGATDTYTVKVTYRITGTGTLSQCTTAGTGLHNSVTLTGEDGPSSDNTACADPITPKPLIDLVKKGSATTLAAPGPVTYTYTVTNPGTEPLKTVTLTDDKCTSVTYVKGDTNNDQILQSTETWAYSCTQEIAVNTTNVATAKGTGVASGAQVTDTDNWTVTVTPRVIKITKLDGTTPLAGAGFALYDSDPSASGATPLTNGVKLDPAQPNGSVFLSTGLTYQKDYWLVETKAPTGHELLPRAVKFTVTKTGIVLADPSSNGQAVTVSTTDTFALNVQDAPAATLPLAGGTGTGTALAALLSLLLTVGAMLSYRRTEGLRTSQGGESID